MKDKELGKRSEGDLAHHTLNTINGELVGVIYMCFYAFCLNINEHTRCSLLLFYVFFVCAL